MTKNARTFAIAAGLLAFIVTPCGARSASPPRQNSSLRMVVILSRHGVRSPSGDIATGLRDYANEPWPTWSVHPGFLTPHGALIMRQLGTYYRKQYGPMLGFNARACPPTGSVYVWADVDERTRATGDAIVQGFAPRCGIAVRHAPGDNDPLFDPLPGVGVVNKAESNASILGAVGGNFNALVEAHAAAFATLERVLGCVPRNNSAVRSTPPCKQISQVPTTIANDGDGGLASLHGGLDMASDVGETLLLEYTDGKKDVGWGRVDRQTLIQLLGLHVLAKRLEHFNHYTGQAHSSNVMMHILQTLQEGATNAKVAGTRVPPQSRFVFLSAHDTQEAEIAGILGLSWLVPGYPADDTAPSSALAFELYKNAGTDQSFVRLYFMEPTLDQLREGHATSAIRVPVYVPGCPGFDCPFATFSKVVTSDIDPAFVAPW
jgi:4-phytase/acid phosphatase